MSFFDKVRMESREEGREECRIDTALRMIKSGELTMEKIEEFTDLPIEAVWELAV